MTLRATNPYTLLSLKKTPKSAIIMGMLTKRNMQILVGALSVIVLLVPTAAYAQPVPNAADVFINQLTQLVGMLITAMNVLAWMVFKALDLVMDPNFMFARPPGGGDGALLEMLHNIWQLSRDLMNVIFAVLLLVGAVMTVVNPKGGELLKSNAAKFVLAVLFINFSWFVPRVIIDVSNITAYTVFQLPSLIGGKCEIPPPAGVKEPKKPCTAITNVLFFDRTDILTPSAVNKDIFIDPQKQEWRCPIPKVVCFQEKTFEEIDKEGGFPAHTKVVNGLVVNFGRLKNMAKLSRPLVANPNPWQQLGNVITFLIKMIVVLVIHIALFFPLVAMTVGFFVRIPILWFTMAFMPFAFLGILVGDKLPLEQVQKIWKQFISAAFLPTMVGIPLAIGFIMINAGLNVNPNNIPDGIKALNGAIPLFAQMDDMWQVIWLMVALFVLWTGVFAALEKDEIVKKFTGGIKSIGEATAGLAIKAPLAAPIIPAGAGKPEMSILQAAKISDPRRLKFEIDSTGKLPELFKDPDQAPRERAAKRIDELKAEVKVKEVVENVTKGDGSILADKAKMKLFIEELEKTGKHSDKAIAQALKALGAKPDEKTLIDAIEKARK